MYYYVCEICGAYLDPGETCDCCTPGAQRIKRKAGTTARQKKKNPLTVCRPKAGKRNAAFLNDNIFSLFIIAECGMIRNNIMLC